MGAQFVNCSIRRKTEVAANTGLPGLDFNSSTSTPTIIIDKYAIKIIDYSGVKVDNNKSGIMYKNETKVYGKNYSNKIKKGDYIYCDDGRKFVIKANPVKGIQYLLMIVDEI